MAEPGKPLRVFRELDPLEEPQLRVEREVEGRLVANYCSLLGTGTRDMAFGRRSTKVVINVRAVNVGTLAR